MSDRNIPTDPRTVSHAHEAAFPRPTQYREERPRDVLLAAQWGLTKRELFAAMAMQGFCSAEWCEDRSEETIADLAVGQADALLAALEIEGG